MKLYATIKNTKGKKEGVGDNIHLDIFLAKGNMEQYYIGYTTEGIMIYNQGKLILDTIYSQGKNQKGEMTRSEKFSESKNNGSY